MRPRRLPRGCTSSPTRRSRPCADHATAATVFFPHHEKNTERLQMWLAEQDVAGSSAATMKVRRVAVAAWYREMWRQGRSTFDVTAALLPTRGR